MFGSECAPGRPDNGIALVPLNRITHITIVLNKQHQAQIKSHGLDRRLILTFVFADSSAPRPHRCDRGLRNRQTIRSIL